jgi:hypothetical protein
VRTIAILPALFKLYEQCLLRKLKTEIREKNLLHECQRGFTTKKSCEDNILELTYWMTEFQHNEVLCRQHKI